MPHAAWVTGSLVYSSSRLPVKGTISFVPFVPWILDQGVYWACLSPTVQLEDGRFGVWLTARSEWWWPYLVETPTEQLKIPVPLGKTSYTLPELMDYEHRPR